MRKNKIQKISDAIVRLKNVHSFGVIGDPGCDGLGTYNMKVYAGALEESAKDDITLVIGDLVPAGTKKYYNEIIEITNVIAENDVYVLRGNHDTGAYEDYFGRHNYAILTEQFAVIVLDNAMRTFEEEGLLLLSEVLALEEVKQAVVTFHIPVPNHFIQNSVSRDEYKRLKKAYEPWKEKVKYLLCGHVHSCFVDEVDGIPLICTGGGGAMIEDVSEGIRACDINHHMVHFFTQSGRLAYEFKDLQEGCYPREGKDSILKERLEDAVKGEMMAHLKYLMFADRAKRRGFDRIANLFEALADSEYRHARNFYSVLERPKAFKEAIEGFIPTEQFEYEKLYKMMAAYAKEQQKPLTKQAYEGAATAEKVHTKLLKEAVNLDGFARQEIYVCPICGYVMTEEEINKKERCPVCGGPQREYKVFVAEA
ncbi:MAG: ferritin family protein [Clostridiales bacterium]|nr:ferritin family protein [Clostridiales bacterium]